MNFRLTLFVATALSCLVLQACEDRVERVPGCDTDEDCASPRMCVDGSCLDPDRVDAVSDGSGDVMEDGGQGDGGTDVGATSDTPVIPDVPAPRSCVVVRPESVNLGERAVGSQTVRSVLVENCGRIDVTLQSAGIFDDEGIFSVVDFPATPVVITPGDSEPLIFRATPTAVAEKQGTIDLQVDDQSFQVGLSVTGVDALESSLCLRAPASISFGTVLAGEAVPPQAVAFENCGDAVLTDLQVLQPDNGRVSVTPSLVSTLEPGESVVLQVSLNADFAANYLAPVSLVNSGASATTFVTASVISEGQSEGCLEFSPAAIDFGSATTLQELESEIELTNCGTVAVEFSGVEIASGTGDVSWLEVGDLAFFMEPGTVQRVPVRFAPQAEGSWAATVVLSTVTPGVPALVIPVTASVGAPAPSP
ncbi:MAG: choice-of-anchor D domain-containing protein [Myxococcales bacterium]|nr:choice-of-anchor D domain-containing protein [Myxococcales bacterium]